MEVLMFHPGAKLNNRYVISQDAPMDGGQARVFHAWDEVARLDVAIKQPLVGSNAHIRARFKQEAEVHAMLDHPNILKMYGVESVTSHRQHNGVEIIPPGASGTEEIVVLEWVPEGFNLWQLIEMHRTASILHKGLFRGSCVPMSAALDILVQVAGALVYIHGSSVIHRDLKPSNILLVERDDGSYLAKISDFGTAKDSDSNRLRKLTSTGQTLGSLGYMSWEQGFGKAVPASDVWSLIVTTYEAVTGCLPYSSHRLDTAQDCVDLWQLIRAGKVEIDPVDRYCVGTPSSLVNAIKLGLNPDPVFRPSAAEVLRILTVLRDELKNVELAETQFSFIPISSHPPQADKLAETQDAPIARVPTPTEQFFGKTFELPVQPVKSAKPARVIIAADSERAEAVSLQPEVMVIGQMSPSAQGEVLIFEAAPVLTAQDETTLPPPVVTVISSSRNEDSSKTAAEVVGVQSRISTQPPTATTTQRARQPSPMMIVLLGILAMAIIFLSLTAKYWLPLLHGDRQVAATVPVQQTAPVTSDQTRSTPMISYKTPAYSQPARTATPAAVPSKPPPPIKSRPASAGDVWIGGEGLPPGAPPPMNQ